MASKPDGVNYIPGLSGGRAGWSEPSQDYIVASKPDGVNHPRKWASEPDGVNYPRKWASEPGGVNHPRII